MKEPVEVSISEIEEILGKYLDAEGRINYALKIIGHPGIGKSEIVKQVAERKNYFFIDTRLAFKENIDLGGYPVPDHTEKRMIYYRPKFIPPQTIPEPFNGILWFLDEANRAHPTVIQTLFQIITEHVCGEHLLPERTAIVLSGNLGHMDSTMMTEFDDAALDGRLAIFHLKPNVEDWLQWAAREDIHPAVIRYISLFPEKLWDETHIDPNPRGWHQVSQALLFSFGISTDDELARTLQENPDGPLEKMVYSLVGRIAGRDFVLQHTAPRELTTRQVLTGDQERLACLKKNTIPTEDLLWALSGAVSVLREKKIAAQGDLPKSDLAILCNVLQFTGNARTDLSLSFFYLLIKECGILTEIPAALGLLDDDELAGSLCQAFGDFLED